MGEMSAPATERRSLLPGGSFAMKKIFSLVTVIAAAASAHALTFFYGGDADGRDAFAEQHGGMVTSALAFDDFDVLSSNTITGLFVNALDTGPRDGFGFASLAHYQIRASLSAGNSGTLLASGTVGVTHVGTVARSAVF